MKMHYTKFPSNTLSEVLMRFVIIIAIAAVWCGLSIPVEGHDNEALNKIAGVRNCLKAIKEVQSDLENVEKVKAFTTLCEAFIDELELSESHIKLLEHIGYKKGEKIRDTSDENAIQDKETSDKKDMAKDQNTSHKQEDTGKDGEPGSAKIPEVDKDVVSADKKTDSKKDREDIKKNGEDIKKDREDIKKDREDIKKDREDIKKDREDTKKDKDNTKVEEATENDEDIKEDEKDKKKVEKATEKDEDIKEDEKDKKKVEEASRKDEEYTNRETEDTNNDKDNSKKDKDEIKEKTLKEQVRQFRKFKKAAKQAAEASKKTNAKEIGTESEKEKTPEHAPLSEKESEQTDRKPTTQGEQVQNQNPQVNIPVFDFSMLEIPELTPEDLAAAEAELAQVQKAFETPPVQSKVHMHANFPERNAQEMREEWRLQFQDPSLGAGMPHVQMKPDHREAVPNPTLQQGVPPFPQQDQFERPLQQDQFERPFQQDQFEGPFQRDQFEGPFQRDQFEGPFQQDQFEGPFQQDQFEGPFQQDQFEGAFQQQHFDQGIPQVPPVPEWGEAVPSQKFVQGIPQPNTDAEAANNVVDEAHQALNQQQTAQSSNVESTNGASSSKRKADEL